MDDTPQRIDYHWRAVETLDGLYQPQVGRHLPGEVKTTWRNAGSPMHDQFAAEDAAKISAEHAAATF